MSSLLKLKTSQQSNTKNTIKKEPKKTLQQQQPKPIEDHEEEQDPDLVVTKKIEKKNIPSTLVEGWQPMEEQPKELPLPSTGHEKKQLKKQVEVGANILQEEFPDLNEALAQPQTKKEIKKIQNQQQQPSQNIQNSDNKPKFSNTNPTSSLFTNSKPTTNTQVNSQTSDKKLVTNDAPFSFTHSQKQEMAQKFQQQQEQIKKQDPPPQEPDSKVQVETAKPQEAPQKVVMIARNTGASANKPDQEKPIKVEESVPSFTNSKAKEIQLKPQQAPQQQQQQQQPQQQQQQQEKPKQPQVQLTRGTQAAKTNVEATEDVEEQENDDGWQIVEGKAKKTRVSRKKANE